MRYTQDATCCPKCGHTYLSRRRRRLWMKLLGIDKHLRCDNCGCRVLYREPRKPAQSSSD